MDPTEREFSHSTGVNQIGITLSIHTFVAVVLSIPGTDSMQNMLNFVGFTNVLCGTAQPWDKWSWDELPMPGSQGMPYEPPIEPQETCKA